MTLNIGVIGTGMIGRDHTRRIQQVLAGAEVVALSDVNAASAEAVRKDLAPSAKIYETGEALIAAHRNPAVPEAYVTPMAIHDTMIHEIDVFRWLLNDDYVSARVLYPRNAARSHSKLRDPQVVVLETQKGVLIDVEIFVNCAYGYDIQCEVVGEEGTARLPEPMTVDMRLGAQRQSSILTDWKDRFVASYDVELNDFIGAASQGGASGPSAWDGYAAAVTSDACVKAQESDGQAVAIELPIRPALYN